MDHDSKRKGELLRSLSPMPLGVPTPVREEGEAGHTLFYPVALVTDVQMFAAYPCWQHGTQ